MVNLTELVISTVMVHDFFRVLLTLDVGIRRTIEEYFNLYVNDIQEGMGSLYFLIEVCFYVWIYRYRPNKY